MADLNRMAHRIAQQSTESKEPTRPKVSGRNGGLRGGAARAARLTPEKRSEIARKAARARWAKQRNAP
jgi:hypothetical protein